MVKHYNIDGCVNLGNEPGFFDPNIEPMWNQKLEEFKKLLEEIVENKESKVFLRLSDGEFYFLKGEAVGSAKPGNRALAKSYSDIITKIL